MSFSYSSVVSEYSRRASEVVSPSDLPDSPSESMPSSPKHNRSVKFRMNDQNGSFFNESSATIKPADTTVHSQTIIVPAQPLTQVFHDSTNSYAAQNQQVSWKNISVLGASQPVGKLALDA